MINAATLGDALRLGEVADEELTGIFGTVFPLARWESNDRVNYFHSEQGHVLDVVYSKRGQILRFEPRPGLTDELVAELREHVDAAFAQDAGVEIRRGLLFGMPPVNGFWRHGDDWQILPAPPQAPRPRALMGDHPFVLEYRVRSSSAFSVALMRRSRRYWELHLLLSLLLRGQITRETFEPQHHWVILPEPMPNGLQTAYVNEGYLVGEGFLLVADDFSDPSEYRSSRSSRMTTTTRGAGCRGTRWTSPHAWTCSSIASTPPTLERAISSSGRATGSTPPTVSGMSRSR
jgi:hypothetical protein